MNLNPQTNKKSGSSKNVTGSLGGENSDDNLINGKINWIHNYSNIGADINI